VSICRSRLTPPPAIPWHSFPKISHSPPPWTDCLDCLYVVSQICTREAVLKVKTLSSNARRFLYNLQTPWLSAMNAITFHPSTRAIIGGGRSSTFWFGIFETDGNRKPKLRYMKLRLPTSYLSLMSGLRREQEKRTMILQGSNVIVFPTWNDDTVFKGCKGRLDRN